MKAAKVILFTTLSFSLLIYLWIVYNNRIIINNLDNYNYDQNFNPETEFNHKYMTYDEISDYLNNTTMLMTKPVTNVVYVSANHNYIRWYDHTIHNGSWASRWKLMHIIWGSRSRWTLVQLVCMISYKDNEMEQPCVIAYDSSQLFSLGHKPEKATGNVFGLSKNSIPPFGLPDGAITIQELSKNISAAHPPK